jgi:hypothetical protein
MIHRAVTVSRTRSVATALAVALGALPGCYATLDDPPPVVVHPAAPVAIGFAEVTSAPVDIETYPSVVYEGRPTYFYGDRWWYRDGARWSSYQSEPSELHRQREFVQRAPRARAPRERRAPRDVREEAPRGERR